VNGTVGVYPDDSWVAGTYLDAGCIVTNGASWDCGPRCGIKKIEVKRIMK